MNNKTKGIILKQQDYKEHDAIISIFTFDYGLLSFIAKGIRKNESKNSSSLLPFTESEIVFDYLENKTIFNLHTANCLYLTKNIHNDLIKSTVANVFAELLLIIAKDEKLPEKLYILLKDCLVFLDKNYDYNLVLALFFANILDYLGIAPEVDECCICSNKLVSAISIDDGGFVCDNCFNGKKENPYFLKQFRLVNKATSINLEVLSHYSPYSFNHVNYLYDFLNSYLSIKLNSYQFLLDILKL